MEELLTSPLQLHFEDLPYIRNYFKLGSMNKTIQIIVSQNRKSQFPLFLDANSGINLIKEGSFAFYGSKLTAYLFIEKWLTPYEICSLREAENFIVGKNSYKLLVLQRESQYIEMFRYGIMKAKEFGFDQRQLISSRPRKPFCEAPNPVHYVSFQEIRIVFYLLAIAFYISLVILVLENCFSS